MNKRKLMKSSLFRTLFALTLIGSVAFSTLFITHVTSPDINYFIISVKTSAKTSAKKVKNDLIAKTNTMKNMVKKTEHSKSAKTKTIAKKHIPKDTKHKSSHINQNTILKSSMHNVVYYNQTDDRWRDKIYGEDNTIGVYGCGPTTLAMLVSSLTQTNATPHQIATWAYDNGYFCNNSGSYHTIIPEGSEHFGLNVSSSSRLNSEDLINELSSGKFIVVLLNKGQFTSDGHFVILRGISKSGNVLVADSKSLKNSLKEWDVDIFIQEAKYGSTGDGPFWAVSKK